MSIYLQRKKLARKITICSVVFIAIIGLLCFLADFKSFVKNLPTENDIPKISQIKFDGLIAYTGGQYRLGTTALIIKNGFKGPVLISGVFPGSNLEKTFYNLGLSKKQVEQINLDYNAVSTVGNVQQTANWVNSNNLQQVLIITSYYHIPRTKLLLKNQLGENVKFIAYPVFSNNASPTLVFAEYIKFLLSSFTSVIKFSLNSQLPY